MNYLEIAEEITNSQYMSLLNPIFVGQTKLDKDGNYWMVFMDNNKYYKIYKNILQ